MTHPPGSATYHSPGVPYRIDPTQPPPGEARRVLAEQLGRAIERIDAADAHDPESVRRVRVCCKKARGVLRLARGPLADEFTRENKDLASIARSLAASRDAQAVLDAFDGVATGADAPPSVSLVRATLDAQRDLEVAGAGDRAPALTDARPRLAAALERAAELPLDTLAHEHMWEAFTRTYRRARRAMSGAMANPDPSYSHEWRTWVKRHWYHVRLLQAARPKAMAARAERLDRLNERLGRRHDLDILRDRLRDPEGPLHALGGAGWALKRAERAAERLTLASVREGLELFADKPGRLTGPLAASWRKRTSR